MKKQDNNETKTKKVGKQLAKNVGAAAIGSAVGYYGAGTLLRKAMGSKKFTDMLSQMPKEKKSAILKKLRTASSLASGTAAGLSSIAIHNALTKDKDSSEKVAQFCIMYCKRRLV